LPGFEMFLDTMADPNHEEHDRRHRHPPPRRQGRLPEEPPLIARRPAGYAYGDDLHRLVPADRRGRAFASRPELSGVTDAPRR
jgi:hypothetical protein